MNVLVLSCGTRNKIIQYFRKELAGSGCVVAADCSSYAPALYDADRYYIVPRITAADYIDIILDICRKENISGVLSLIDPELSLLAEHEKEFNALGVTVIGSPYELCEMSLDKWAMYQWLCEKNFACAKTYIDFEAFEKDLAEEKLEFPVFVKPRFGSASLGISKADDIETAKFLFYHQKDMIVQEFLNGQEIGADVYIDMLSGETVSIFAKNKLVMRAGETDKAISFKDNELFALIENFVKKAGYRGQIDIDIFEINGQYYISEVNPRFGGGYPHAYECGANHMRLILNNLNGDENKKQIGNYRAGLVMMKYNEIKVIQDE